MARSLWSGSVSFGLVSVPVKLYSATSPKSVKFNQLNAKTGARISQKRVDPSTGDEVAFEDIIKGYEITPDRYVTIEPEELDNLRPKQTKTIDLENFVPLADIDPMVYDKAYYIAPDTGAAKAYKLLVAVMESTDRVGIARFILRSKEQLVALRAVNGVLVASTMLFADEINDDKVARPDADAGEPTEAEVNMATGLISALSAPFSHGDYADTYRNQVLDLIERKAAGEEIVTPTTTEEPSAPAPDLMAALTASLEAVTTEGAPEKTTTRKRSTAKSKAKVKA